MEHQRDKQQQEATDRARLEHLFGEALGDLPTPEETREAWEAFATRRRRHGWRVWMAVASGIAAAVALLVWVALPAFRERPAIEVFASVRTPSAIQYAETDSMLIVRTPATMSHPVVLPDRSRVLLSAASRLEYPKAFSSSERRVRLQGKARFEVAKEARRPFIVVAGEMRTEVLGTVFDVEAYPSVTSRVTLYEGRVRVSDVKHQTEKEISPGEEAQLTTEGNIHLDATTATAAEGWVSGEFLFDNADLKSVMQEVGAWYNVGVLFRSELLLRERIYFRMNHPPRVEQLLEALNDLGIARFTMKRGRIEVS